jgi:hypothetical protein
LEQGQHFPKAEANTLALYVQFIYTGRLPCRFGVGELGGKTEDECGLLCKFYLFAEKVDDEGAKKAVVAVLAEVAREGAEDEECVRS